jgi:hypothetical protein
MNKVFAAVIGGLLANAFLGSALAASTSCPTGNASVPPGANTTRPAAPFYIDTTDLDLQTSPPTRSPDNPSYPHATELPSGKLPSVASNGNFVIGPAHPAAAETAADAQAPRGTVYSFTMSSRDSVIYNPGILRVDPQNCLNASIFSARTAPGDPSNVLVATSQAGTWTRTVDVYVPAGYMRGKPSPFIVAGDGGSAGFLKENQFFTVLDNLIHEKRIPPLVAISIGAGGQDAQGSERGLEYDTVSGAYAEWVEGEVLPQVEHRFNIRLTRNPDGRATMGISSSGAAAFTMAWFHPELYHRVLAYSPTFVNQQWPHNPALPGGAWEYHDPWAGPKLADLSVSGVNVTKSEGGSSAPLVLSSPLKPIRFWFEVGDRDLFYPDAPLADGMHDWVLADEHMAKVLAAKGYHYQFLFSRNATHVDAATIAQTLPEALEWLWQGYVSPK